MKELCNEHKLILVGSKDIQNKNEEIEFKALMGSKLRWEEIIYQCLIHRTLNILFHNIRKFNLVSKIDKELKKMFLNQWHSYYERNVTMCNELSEILKVFKENGVKAALLKGNLLVNLVYPSIETRQYNDIDFLIDLKDVGKITKSLESLGFVQGGYDENEDRIVPATRQEILLQQMNTYELVEFQKKISNAFTKVVVIDLNHDIGWKNAPFNVKTEELLGRCVPIEINGGEGFMLNHIDNLIQLCTHLYREASFMFWITDLRDLKIYKFADIFCYIRRFGSEIDWEDLLLKAKEYEIGKILYYCFHYVEMMYGSIVPDDVMEELKPNDIGYLNEFGIENEKPLVWKTDFFTRLFDVTRIEGIDQKNLKEMDKYITARTEMESRFKHRLVGKES